MAQYDGIITGGGPNGLTLGCYLAKTGLRSWFGRGDMRHRKNKTRKQNKKNKIIFLTKFSMICILSTILYRPSYHEGLSR